MSRPTTATASGYEVLITPRKLAATPAAVPYRLDELSGTVRLLPDHVELKDITAKHGDAKVRFAATGWVGASQTWDFTLSGDSIAVDDDLRKALPPSLSGLLKSMDMKGKMGFEFSKLHIATQPPPQQPSREGAIASAEGNPKPASVDRAAPDVDFECALRTESASLDVGVPLNDVKGAVILAGSSRNGKLSGLSGDFKIDTLTLAGRPITDFRAKLYKPPTDDQLTIGRIEATLARGGMAGQIDYAFPDTGPSRDAVNLTLRNSAVRELAAETEPEIQGQLSASLALEGVYDQPNSRRGRGDVTVVGQKMYRIPLVLGLLQITNLSLPITSPFTQASARYSMDGRKVTFEQIELR